MKRLLIALAAAVAVSTASAIITDTQLFETSHDFEADIPAEDSSAITAYESGAQPSFTAPYPCGSYGENYLKLDTGDATLWRTNASEAATIYFDMAIQFTPTAEGDEPDPTGNKIVVFMDANTNIVVISGTSAADPTPVTNEYEGVISAKSWARLTIAAMRENDALCFRVSVDGEPISRNLFYSLDNDTMVREVGFSGSGALDDFVARTTDPLYEGAYAARIGGTPPACEMYDNFGAALADALMTTTADAATAITLPNSTTVNGSAASPYRIEDADCLMALQDAVFANPAVRSLNFVQTANIDMTDVEGFYGIGWFKSSTAYLSLPNGVTLAGDGKSTTDIPFSGVYDGANYTVSNVTLVRHNYAGLFNCVDGTVKNLTVLNLGVNDTTTAGAHGDLEWGCGIVGNAQGNAVLASLTAETSAQDGFWGNNANHNTGGIAARAEDNATITGCVNNVAITSASKRLGGIVAFTGTTAAGDAVTIVDCINNGNLTSTEGSRGVGGILSSPETGTGANTIIKGCSNFGTLTAGASGFTGYIVGSLGVNTSSSYTDAGGNTFLAAGNMLGTRGSNTHAIEGLAYAIDAGIDGANYLTTVAQADLAAGNTYLLLADVAASETPVFTLQAAGDTIAFNTNGFSFAGTVAASDPMVDVSSATDEYGVITYTAAQGTVVATITKGAVTNSYSTLQKAIAAADADPDADTVDLVANAAISGEVNIPSGVTVVLADGVSLANVTVLSGAGVLSVPSPTEVGLVQTDHAANLLKDGDAWTGTLSIKNVSLNGPDGLSYYGNTNSTVRMENVWLSNWTSSHAIGTLDLVGTGLYIVTTSGNMTFPCALTGDGPISVRDTCTTAAKVVFTGDVSGYTGNINLASSAVSVNFGSATTTSGGSIIVESGSVVTNVSTATWTANNLIVIGEMEANGTVNLGSTGKLWCNTGTGVYRANSTTAAVPVADSWNSTYVIGWAGSHSTAIDFDSYGNANSTIEIPEGSTLQGYIGSAQGGTYNLAAKEIVVNGVLDLSNGYNTSTVGWKKISGSGTVKFRFAPSTAIYEKITLLDGFSGSIEVSATTQLEIGTVNIAREPSADQLIVPLTVTSGGTVGGDLNLTVSGTASGTLEYKAAGANGEGLYVKASAPTVPTIYPSASASAECGSAADATAAADAINAAKATYIKAPAEAELSGEAAETYASLFTARAEGTSVVVELNAAGTNALETTASAIAAQIVATDNLASVLSGTRSISVTGAQPGFFYSVVYATTLSALSSAEEGDRMMATAAGVVPLAVPAPASGATTGFYRVLVNVEPKVTE